MLTLILATTVLAVLYGLAWHNEPAKGRPDQRSKDSPRSTAKT